MELRDVRLRQSVQFIENYFFMASVVVSQEGCGRCEARRGVVDKETRQEQVVPCARVEFETAG